MTDHILYYADEFLGDSILIAKRLIFEEDKATAMLYTFLAVAVDKDQNDGNKYIYKYSKDVEVPMEELYILTKKN